MLKFKIYKESNLYIVLQMFLTAVKVNSAFIGRMMLEEIATTGASMLVDILNKRKVYLGTTKKGDVDYIDAEFKEEDIRSLIRDKKTLNFSSSIFPQDISFKDMPKTDVLINNWDDIVDEVDDGEDADDVLSFITFSGNNPMAEKSLRLFAKMNEDAREYPTMEDDLDNIAGKMVALRDFCIEFKVKLLAHSTDNLIYLTIYSPEAIVDFKDDLTVYLEERSYPFGTLIGIININISMRDRQNGVIENTFEKGNINSTYELLSQKLKVAPSMKAIVNDSERRSLVKSVDVNFDNGFVIAPSGAVRLPNVVDYVYIPAAILSCMAGIVKFKESLSTVELTLSQKDFSQYLAKTIMARADKSIDERYAEKDLLEYNRKAWIDGTMVEKLKEMINTKNIPYSTTGLKIFHDSWAEAVEIAQLVSTTDEVLLYPLAHEMGYDQFFVDYRRFPHWLEKIESFGKNRYGMKFDANKDEALFLEGLFKLIRGLNSGDYAEEGNKAKLEHYIENYDTESSHNLSIGAKFKSKKLIALAGAIQDAYTVATEGEESLIDDAKSLIEEVLK